MEQGQSEESLIESSERTDELRMRNTPAGKLEASADVKWHILQRKQYSSSYFGAAELVPGFFTSRSLAQLSHRNISKVIYVELSHFETAFILTSYP